MMKLYSYPFTRGTRITWTLEETGAEYEYFPVDLTRGEARRPPYTDLNPGGKVPTLVDGDLVLTESAAICTWIGDRFPDAALVPEPRTADRALCDKWCFFVASELEQPLWTVAKHTFALPEGRRVPEVRDTARWEFGVACEVLAAGLEDREYLVGDRFTVADLLAAHTLAWARRAKADPGADLLTAYAERCLRRPAFDRVRQREQAVLERLNGAA